MPGLMRGVARTAVIAGTATAVSNRVSRRQANRWAEQEYAEPQYAQPAPQYVQPAPQYVQPAPTYTPPPAPAPAAAAAPDPYEQLKQLAELKDRGILTEVEFAAQKAKVLGI